MASSQAATAPRLTLRSSTTAQTPAKASPTAIGNGVARIVAATRS